MRIANHFETNINNEIKAKRTFDSIHKQKIKPSKKELYFLI